MTTANSLSGLIKFISKTQWNEELSEVLAHHLGPACLSADIEPHEIHDILGQGHCDTLWGCALEDLMAMEFEDGSNVVDDYLKRRGHVETSVAKRYMQALRGAVMSLYEISDVVPGQSFLARDLIRGGDPVRVLEKSGSMSLKAWDRIAARLVYLGSEWHMSGGVLPLSREASDFAIHALEAVDGRLPDDFRNLAGAAIGRAGLEQIELDLADTMPLELAGPAFTSLWLTDALDRTLNPQIPQLRNTDGDEIVLCTSRFSMHAGIKPAQCRLALAGIPGLQQEDAKFFNWVGDAVPAPIAKPLQQADDTLTIMSSNDNGQTILGSIEIKKAAIELSTNSRERAARGEALIANALSECAGKPVREEMHAEEILAESRQKKPARPQKTRAEIPPDQARTIIHAQLDQHYRKTLDEPVPALGGLSPREAANSKTNRHKVVEWLKTMENNATKAGGGTDPMASYDFGWIWTELGVAQSRV